MRLIEVKPGQVWEDCDKRMNGRRIKVEKIDDKYAYCHRVAFGGWKVRILLSRMRPNSTGFKLVENA
jgi:hypothetical protein